MEPFRFIFELSGRIKQGDTSQTAQELHEWDKSKSLKERVEEHKSDFDSKLLGIDRPLKYISVKEIKTYPITKQWVVDYKLTSDDFICLEILQDKTLVCYSTKDRYLKFFNPNNQTFFCGKGEKIEVIVTGLLKDNE